MGRSIAYKSLDSQLTKKQNNTAELFDYKNFKELPALEKIKDFTTAIKILERELWKLRSEKEGISHIIHEDILQSLVAAKTYTKNLLSESDYQQKQLLNVSCIIDYLISRLKFLHKSISTPPFQLIGLTGAINELMIESNKQEVINYEVEKIDEKLNTLDQYTQFHIYQITAELLKNINQHAHAQKAHIYTHVQNKFIYLNIWDDGIGFYNTERHWREGLTKIKMSVMELKGRMILESSPGLGCLFRAVIPLTKKIIHKNIK